METIEYCTAYEVPLQEVPEDLLQVCNMLGEQCENCPHRIS